MDAAVNIPGITGLSGYSYVEDATPLVPGAPDGAVGELSFTSPTFPDAIWLQDKNFVFTDNQKGSMTGVVRGVDETDRTSLQVTAQNVLGLFNIEVTVEPFVGTFGGAMAYWCALAHISNDVVMAQEIADRAVSYPGWLGNVWEMVKNVLTAEELEITTNEDDHIVVRKLRERDLSFHYDQTEGESANQSETAQYVDVTYYGNTHQVDAEVYPIPEDEKADVVLQVDAGATEFVDIQVNASMLSVNQPECVEWVDNRSYAGTEGVYSVVGNDNLPVPPEMWTQYGGSLRVERLDDPSVIRIIVQGASYERLAPYRVAAMSSGGGHYYNSLHITGEAVVQNRRVVRIPTGADPDLSGQEVGMLVENPFIRTVGQAIHLGGRTAARFNGIDHTYNSAGDNVDQPFGNIAGSRIRGEDVIFRVDRVESSPESVSVSASVDTTLGDFASVYEGDTLQELQDEWAGLTLRELLLRPLRRRTGA